jgi:sugar-specific transcriptional regulator TrmB
MDILSLLNDCGLTEKEARIYIALLRTGPSTIKPIADQAGVKRTSVYNFIDRLLTLGLVSRAIVKGRNVYQALTPKRLLDLQKTRVSLLDQALPELLLLFTEKQDRPRVSYFEGPLQVRNIVKEETRCKKLACYLWPGRDVMDMIGGVKYMTSIDKERIKKGVHIRAIRFRHKDIPYRTSAHGQKFLRELRYAPAGINVSMGMGIYDTGKVGFFSSKKEGFGMLVESKEFAELMLLMYGYLWSRCSSASPGEG